MVAYYIHLRVFSFSDDINLITVRDSKQAKLAGKISTLLIAINSKLMGGWNNCPIENQLS